MKIHISRQMIYIVTLAVVFLFFVFLFAFAFLIPSGKDYRLARLESKKISYQTNSIQEEYDKVFKHFKGLQKDHRHILKAYKNIFNPERFVQMNEKYFESFSLSELTPHARDENFAVYEVNTSSLIQSPQGFYDFLDGVNKSDNIIAINFPIDFKRDANLIKSSFTMHVYISSKSDSKE
ncbi:hypothetical protein JHD50_11705 [Sulfurimonas sp. MAG313]|nr:hypothetical protein [Sulfurimonas sp. MAG313]MDF1881953.1 hypothetical protein [Sulfurimonas sp. MAG313]